MGVSENLKRGVTELALLCLLSQRDMYGYEMSQALDKYSEGRFTLQESSMYPTLYRLQDKGLVSVRSVPAGKRRMRMYYHLEQSGKEYMEKICRSISQSSADCGESCAVRVYGRMTCWIKSRETL